MLGESGISIPGIVLAGIVAFSAWLLSRWESVRPRWPRPGALDRLSDRLRRIGILLMWLESVLLGIGSQLPTSIKSDRLLFVSIWAIVAIVAILLVTFALADSLVRLMAHRVRATAVNQVWETLDFKMNEMKSRPILDPNDDEDDFYDSH